MKKLKLIASILLFSSVTLLAQTPVPGSDRAPEKKDQATETAAPEQLQKPAPLGRTPGEGGMARVNRFMVQVPHTREQCADLMKDLKEKGGPMMMRFDWGCNSGEHIGFAMFPGQTEEAVRKQLPEGIQKIAKITKVEKMGNNAQMEMLHK